MSKHEDAYLDAADRARHERNEALETAETRHGADWGAYWRAVAAAERAYEDALRVAARAWDDAGGVVD